VNEVSQIGSRAMAPVASTHLKLDNPAVAGESGAFYGNNQPPNLNLRIVRDEGWTVRPRQRSHTPAAQFATRSLVRVSGVGVSFPRSSFGFWGLLGRGRRSQSLSGILTGFISNPDVADESGAFYGSRPAPNLSFRILVYWVIYA